MTNLPPYLHVGTSKGTLRKDRIVYSERLPEPLSARMSDRNSGGRRLRQWLIEQIESNLYPGLMWEDEGKTMFRIPWKHAGKQDYNQEIDASIFKAWAVFKGKFKEGDKAEPATWKTRLRCALNKSPDFEEVTERSQLDISEPYKVYRIVPEEEQKTGKISTVTNESSCSETTDMEYSPSEIDDLLQEPPSDDYFGIIKRSHSPPQVNTRIPSQPEQWPQPSMSSLQDFRIGPFTTAFSNMMIEFFYGGKPVGRSFTMNDDGCRISLSHPHLSNDMLYGADSLQNIKFPPAELIDNVRQRQITKKLFGHLERGVLLKSNREGIFIKRLCQSRVFWTSFCAPYTNMPNKLERDAVVRIFDTSSFHIALQQYREDRGPVPDPKVTLCFGEEFPDGADFRYKLITVQITQMNCQQVLEAMTAQKNFFNSSHIEISVENHSDQMARILQDLCSDGAAQRSYYQGTQQITA
ncbi:interferon regulatory factor 8 isoform X1 [Polypterus senegalus]